MNLEGYEFIDKISTDANSETWTARKQASEQTVVIKALNRNNVTPNHYKMIIENAKKAQKHQHTNITTLHDIIEQDELTCFISDHIIGENINETIKRSGVLEEEMALTISLCIAGMLDMTHRKNQLSHGHISPSNIIINEEGVIKLVGLGIPFDIHANSLFKAPEQDASQSPHLTADMYSIGTIIHFMLTAKTDSGETDTNQSPAATISDKTSKLIAKLTQKSPDDRYATWKEAIADIEKAIPAPEATDSTPSTTVATATSVKIASAPSSTLTAPSSATVTPDVKVVSMPKETDTPAAQPSEAVTPAPVITNKDKQDKPTQTSTNQKQTESKKQPIKKKSPTKQKKTYSTKNRKKAKVPPQGFRNIAWFLLLLFLAWFAHKQMTNQPTMIDTLLAKAQDLTTNITIAPQSNTDPIPEEVEETPIQEVKSSVLAATKKQAVAYLLASNIPEAKRAISQSTAPEVKGEASGLLRFINDITNADTYIANNFSKRIGQTTVIMFGDVKREIILSSVSGLSITAKLDGETEPVVFNLRELPTGEKLRLLESQGDATASAIKLLLNMKLGNINEAKMLAGSCGPLADAFAEQLKTQ